jgi:Flp pilus assembly protein protease CpaA
VPLAIELWIVAWASALIYFDLGYRRLPNGLIFGAVVCALIYFLIFGRSLLGASNSQVAMGVVVGLLLTVPGYLLKGLGAGDVKLMVAIACLGGLNSVVVSFVIGSLLVAILLATRLMWLPLLAGFPRLSRWMFDPSPRQTVVEASSTDYKQDAVKKGTDKNIPFGAALAVGLLVQLLTGLDVGG